MSTPLDRLTELAREDCTSLTLGTVRGVKLEEPAAGNLHGGVCEGGGTEARHGKPNRARSRKRRRQTRGAYPRVSEPPLLGGQ